MNEEREKLADELFEVYYNAKTKSVYDNHTRWLAVADYVIAERKKTIEEYKTIFFCDCDRGGK